VNRLSEASKCRYCVPRFRLQWGQIQNSHVLRIPRVWSKLNESAARYCRADDGERSIDDIIDSRGLVGFNCYPGWMKDILALSRVANAQHWMQHPHDSLWLRTQGPHIVGFCRADLSLSIDNAPNCSNPLSFRQSQDELNYRQWNHVLIRHERWGQAQAGISFNGGRTLDVTDHGGVNSKRARRAGVLYQSDLHSGMGLTAANRSLRSSKRGSIYPDQLPGVRRRDKTTCSRVRARHSTEAEWPRAVKAAGYPNWWLNFVNAPAQY